MSTPTASNRKKPKAHEISRLRPQTNNWRACGDSNSRPLAPEANTLSAELQALSDNCDTLHAFHVPVKVYALPSNHSQSEKCSPTKGRVWRKLRKSSSPVLKRPETAQTRTTMSAGSGKRYDKPAPDVPFSPADRGSVSPAVPPALCRRDEIPDLRERFRQKFHVRMPSAQPDDDFPRVPNDSARYRE